MDELKVLGDQFYFARHGETDFNKQGLLTGSKDIQLNSTGIAQAKQSQPTMARIAISACICSAAERSLQTAQLMLQGKKTFIYTIKGLVERHWGTLEGLSKADLDLYDFDKAGVESWQDFIDRVLVSLKNAERLQLQHPLLIVAHSGTFRVLCEYLKVDIEKKPVHNAYPYRFFKENDRWCVQVVD